MKIKTISLDNVLSFDRATIDFNPEFNLIVGPNGGGKSNFLDALTTILRINFCHPYEIDKPSTANSRVRHLRHIQRAGNSAAIGKYYGRVYEAQSARISFSVTQNDLDGLNAIKANRDRLNQARRLFQGGPGRPESIEEELDFLANHTLSEGMELAYELPNLAVNTSLINPPAEGTQYLRYLSQLEWLTLLARNQLLDILGPALLYFPPSRTIERERFEVSLAVQDQIAVQTGFTHATSKQPGPSAAQLGLRYFAGLLRDLEANSKRDEFKHTAEVQLLTKYIAKLGYDWHLLCKDPQTNLYEFALSRGNRQIGAGSFSSGQMEFLNFLLGVFALGVRRGCIIIDEPELHLHPAWQGLLLEMLRESQSLTGNQIIIATHSPVFVTPNTVAHVMRFSLSERGASEVQTIDRTNLPEARQLMQILTTEKNEILFFADFVVLVEGIMDRHIFVQLFERLKADDQQHLSLQVLNVGGKQQFHQYRNLLGMLGVPYAIIADLDYAKEIGPAAIKTLFQEDFQKIGNQVLGNQKSKDRAALATQLEHAITTNDLTQLEEVWRYIRQARTSLTTLGPAQRRQLDQYIDDCKDERIYLLPQGQIEDHLPAPFTTLNGAIELMESENCFAIWRTANQKGIEALEAICNNILGIAGLKTKSAPF
jgi:putative ATP-dependent endonuclease of OLD family